MLRESQARCSAHATALVALVLGFGGAAFPRPLAAAESTLYSTDFDAYSPTGDDTLVGQGGWLGTNEGEGLHGVDSIDGTGLLGQSAYLAGDTFSIADISFGVFYGFAEMVEKMAGVDFERDRPNLKRWYGEVASRPSFG